MSGRIFQNVVLQFKETTDRTIGVIDSEGTVIACSELTGIGKKWTKYVEPIAAAEGNCVTMEGKTFKAMPGWGTHFDYAVFTSGDDSVGRTVCSMACVALNAAKVYYEEKHDKGSFIKNIISDNILISDIYMRAKELHVAAEVPRGVFVIRPVDDRAEAIPVDVVQNMFPDRQNDFVLSVGDDDVALIHQMPEGTTGKDLEKVATQIVDALRVDGENRVFVGIGTLASTAFIEMLLDTPVETLDVEKCVAAWKSWEETEKDIYRIFDNDPEFVARGLVETKGKYVDKEGLRRQLQRLQKAWPALSGHIRRQIIPFGEVRRRLELVGAPYEPEHIGVSRAKFRASFEKIPYMRSRFTVIDIAFRCGWMDEWLDKLFGKGGIWEIK